MSDSKPQLSSDISTPRSASFISYREAMEKLAIHTRDPVRDVALWMKQNGIHEKSVAFITGPDDSTPKSASPASLSELLDATIRDGVVPDAVHVGARYIASDCNGWFRRGFMLALNFKKLPRPRSLWRPARRRVASVDIQSMSLKQASTKLADHDSLLPPSVVERSQPNGLSSEVAASAQPTIESSLVEGAMFPFEEEIAAIGFGGGHYVRAWIRQNRPHPTVATFMRRGSAFARAPFGDKKAYRGKERDLPFRRADELKAATRALWHVLTHSHEARLDLFSAEFVDVFATGEVSDALNAVFRKKGWSSYVWPAQFVEQSSFRAAIGMALVIYAFYLHRAYTDGDINAAITQCADATNLLVLDLEKRSSIKHKKAKEALTVIPRQFALKGARARAEKYEVIAEEARRLARDRVPASGHWSSRAAAARAIVQDVLAFAKAQQKPLITLDPVGRVDGYLKTMDDADTLFAGKRPLLAGKQTASTG